MHALLFVVEATRDEDLDGTLTLTFEHVSCPFEETDVLLDDVERALRSLAVRGIDQWSQKSPVLGGN